MCVCMYYPEQVAMFWIFYAFFNANALLYGVNTGFHIHYKEEHANGTNVPTSFDQVIL